MTTHASELCARFGDDTFHFETMRQCVSGETVEKLMFAIRNGRPISTETADAVAHAMKEWAIQRGATHYAHWFQPLVGTSAETHDSFLARDDSGHIIDRFTGTTLMMTPRNEIDISNEAGRGRFETRGFPAWDLTSPAFLRRKGNACTLFLPSVYTAAKGGVLDRKTPLLASMRAVSAASVRMLRLLGNKRVTGAIANVGPKQEFFLVDAHHLKRRPDLGLLGTTLVGNPSSCRQHLCCQYTQTIAPRVLTFMEQVEMELSRMGIPVKTRHNEAALAQYELAVLHSPANVAADQNQLLMDVLLRAGHAHGFEVLLHEKPFAHLNGSGKHVHWSIIDSDGTNLLSPGSSRAARIRFLIFLMAVVSGVKRHGPLLLSFCASPGNELRLGGSEAPPPCQYIRIGPALNAVLDNLTRLVDTDAAAMSDRNLGLTDDEFSRNAADGTRTSPVAFSGQKIEFRSIGASAEISSPVAVMNAVVAESLDLMSTRMEKLLRSDNDRFSAALSMLREFIVETKEIRFDGTPAQWNQIHEKDNAIGLPSTPQMLDAMTLPSTIKLFSKYELMTDEETKQCLNAKFELYNQTILMEMRVMRQMLSAGILPVAYRHQLALGSSIDRAIAAVGAKADGVAQQLECLREITSLIGKLIGYIARLGEMEKEILTLENCKEVADALFLTARPLMSEARIVADRFEQIIEDSQWPFPRYDQMLIHGTLVPS